MIIGLTGSIGMGKSTAAQILKKFGLPIYSADAAVHDLLKKNGAGVAPIARSFPGCVTRGAVDRKRLGREVFAQPKKLRQLERILHPLVRQKEKAFVMSARKAKAAAVVLEIPLLFETGAERRCDVTLCVTAPRAIQKARVLARPGMSEDKLKAILARQMPHSLKHKKADFVVPTGKGIAMTEKRLHKVLQKLSLLA